MSRWTYDKDAFADKPTVTPDSDDSTASLFACNHGVSERPCSEGCHEDTRGPMERETAEKMRAESIRAAYVALEAAEWHEWQRGLRTEKKVNPDMVELLRYNLQPWVLR